MNNDVCLFIETESNKLRPQSFSLINMGKELASDLGGELWAILIGDVHDEILGQYQAQTEKDIKFYGFDKLYYFQSKKLSNYSPEEYSEIIANFLKDEAPFLFLAEASPLGNDLMARVASRIRKPLVTDCHEIEIQEKVRFFKLIQNGRFRATIRPKKNDLILSTISSEALSLNELKDFHKPTSDIINLQQLYQKETYKKIQYKSFVKADHRTIDISEAEIIIALGKGIGKKDNFSIYQKIADHLGATLGATRPVIDLGILPFESQIGQTGKEVTPKLIIMCGISGAPEFMKGIEGAGTKIAVNIDAKAPVLKNVDLGIIAEVNEFMEKFLKYLENKKQK